MCVFKGNAGGNLEINTFKSIYIYNLRVYIQGRISISSGSLIGDGNREIDIKNIIILYVRVYGYTIHNNMYIVAITDFINERHKSKNAVLVYIICDV